MLHLIKMWLEAPVEEIDERGRHHRTTRNKDEGRGTPQGAPISPLLSNLYMRRFVLGWKTLGHERRLRAYIVNYADDFVICCRGTAVQAMAAMREMMQRLRLTVNEQRRDSVAPGTRASSFWATPSGAVIRRRRGGATLVPSRPRRRSRGVWRDQRADRAAMGVIDTEEQVARITASWKGGRTTFDRAGEQSLSSRGPTRGRQAATVVVPQAQGAGSGDQTLPGSIPVREAEPGSARGRRRNVAWAKA